jgi:hypothetical protein
LAAASRVGLGVDWAKKEKEKNGNIGPEREGKGKDVEKTRCRVERDLVQSCRFTFS